MFGSQGVLSTSGYHIPGPLIAYELSDWAAHDLSWAIVGCRGCGTTSLAANLHRHPELELLYTSVHSDVLEDGGYFAFSNCALPTREKVRCFNAWKTKAIVDESVARSRLRGVKHPYYGENLKAIRRLS